MKCMEGILEPLKNQSEPWKSPENMFQCYFYEIGVVSVNKF